MSRGLLLLVVADADEVSGDVEGSPGDVKPAVAGEELVGQVVGLQEVDEVLELGRIFGADVGSTALKVLGASDTPNPPIDGLATETGIDDDGTTYGLSGGFQQLTTTVDHIGNLLYGRIVLGVFVHVEKFRQLKVRR